MARYRTLEVRSTPDGPVGTVVVEVANPAPTGPNRVEAALYTGPLLGPGPGRDAYEPKFCRGDRPDCWTDWSGYDAGSVHAALRGLIDCDGRTQAEVATAAGMRPQQLNQVLSGYRENPSVETVGRILAALGRRWADLDGPGEG